jgi:ParB family transcriptional regulator, chromosome partitioning protein
LESDPKGWIEIALIENIQRQELNAIEEASAYQRLINILGLTQEEVAKRVGKDRSSVANYIRLLKLPTTVQNLLVNEQISMGHARALLGIEIEETQEKLAQRIVNEKLSVRETEKLVHQQGDDHRVRETSTQNKNDANIRAAELKLKRILGTQVKIQMGTKGGKINIEFSSASELDRIYSILLRKNEPSDAEIVNY